MLQTSDIRQQVYESDQVMKAVQFQNFAEGTSRCQVVQRAQRWSSEAKSKTTIPMREEHHLGVQPYGAMLMTGGRDCRSGAACSQPCTAHNTLSGGWLISNKQEKLLQ